MYSHGTGHCAIATSREQPRRERWNASLFSSALKGRKSFVKCKGKNKNKKQNKNKNHTHTNTQRDQSS